MANHKSALKRIRSSESKRVRNRYQHKTARTWIKKLRTAESKDDAQKIMGETFGMIDKLAKKGIIHKNKAGNLKSSLQRHVNSL